jgi:hypothetical protein
MPDSLLGIFLDMAYDSERYHTIRCKGTRAVDVPLVKNLFLDRGVATKEIVKGLGVGLRSEDTEGQIMVLEVQTNSGKINKRLDTCSTKFLGVTWLYVSQMIEIWQ